MKIVLGFALALVLLPGLVWAGPIYVYKEPDGVIRFSSKPPPPGVKAEVFSGRNARYSVIGPGSRYHGGGLFRERYKDIIEQAAWTHALDPALIRAIIHVESGFNPYAVSRKGAQGLMQLMPGTGRLYGLKRPFEPADNIDAGSRHMAMLLGKYRGNLTFALAAYNAGEEAVAQYGGIPPYAETQEYVRRVLSMKTRYSVKTKG